MDKPVQNIQDSFLNTARKEKIVITIFLVSGVKLTGRIRSFDKYCLLLESSTQEQMVFKHAISTLVMSRAALRDYRDGQERRPMPVNPPTAGPGEATAARADEPAAHHAGEVAAIHSNVAPVAAPAAAGPARGEERAPAQNPGVVTRTGNA